VGWQWATGEGVGMLGSFSVEVGMGAGGGTVSVGN